MELSKGTVGVIAALCVAVGAGGAYLVNGTGSRAVTVPETVATASPEAPPAPVGEFTAGPTATAEPVAAPATTAPAVRRPAAARQPPTRASNAPSGTLVASPAQPDQARLPEPQAAPIPTPEPASFPEPEPVAAAAPPAREFEELVIPGDSVIGLQIETSMTSDTAEIEDLVIAHVTRDVRVDGTVAIPAGAKVHGLVVLVERGGRLRERARLGVRFTSVVLGDGTRVLLESETVYREGDPPSRESAAKIGGGAIGGAIIGGILGGAKGAAIGGSVGAGAGTAAVLAGGRNAATLPSGTPVTVRLTDVAIVTVDRQ